MNIPDPRSIEWENRDQTITALQIVVGALSAGLLVFCAIVVVRNTFKLTNQLDPMTLVGGGFFLIGSLLSFIVPSAIAGASVSRVHSDSQDLSSQDQAQRLFAAFQVKTIVGCALLEGAGFFNLIVYMTQASILSIVCAVVCVALIAARFPTRSHVLHWIADRMPNS